jgi:hypothetical protein
VIIPPELSTINLPQKDNEYELSKQGKYFNHQTTQTLKIMNSVHQLHFFGALVLWWPIIILKWWY